MPLRNVLILLWATALFWPDGIQAETVVGTIVSVYDGDSVTLLASDGRQIKLRLHGIDAPEIRQPYGRESRESLITLVLGEVVTADIRTRDRYRRSIAVVTVDDIDINAAQVSAHRPRVPTGRARFVSPRKSSRRRRDAAGSRGVGPR